MALAGFNYTRRVKLAQASMGVVPDESNFYDELDSFAVYGMGTGRGQGIEGQAGKVSTII
ncbi:MAG: hypothetical protein GX493_00470 [Firmicutes bacterium]|nr:hypothetical protein [Bacillota bacterium]